MSIKEQVNKNTYDTIGEFSTAFDESDIRKAKNRKTMKSNPTAANSAGMFSEVSERSKRALMKTRVRVTN
jgi:hypothetical protein|tara:strand:+ start:313 stop:522 length:210 start_codon:yes stop_codon:yes gene_type:complete